LLSRARCGSPQPTERKNKLGARLRGVRRRSKIAQFSGAGDKHVFGALGLWRRQQQQVRTPTGASRMWRAKSAFPTLARALLTEIVGREQLMLFCWM